MLKSPSWWFNACVVAIAAGVIAGFLKDWLSRLASLISRRLRVRRQLMLGKQERQLHAFRQSEAVLIVYGLNCLIDLVRLGFICALTMAGPFLTHYYATHREVDPLGFISLPFLNRAMPYLYIILGILGGVEGWRVPMKLSIFVQGYHDLNRKHGV